MFVIYCVVLCTNVFVCSGKRCQECRTICPAAWLEQDACGAKLSLQCDLPYLVRYVAQRRDT